MASAVNASAPNRSGLDDESYNFVLNLLLEDVHQINSTSKGKQRAGTVSDADLALQLYAEELNSASVSAADHRLSRSLQQAVQTDAAAIARFNMFAPPTGCIHDIMNNLREGHECNHQDWRRRRGGHNCESCNDWLPHYIFECSQCNIVACRRCRFNRM